MKNWKLILMITMAACLWLVSASPSNAAEKNLRVILVVGVDIDESGKEIKYSNSVAAPKVPKFDVDRLKKQSSLEKASVASVRELAGFLYDAADYTLKSASNARSGKHVITNKLGHNGISFDLWMDGKDIIRFPSSGKIAMERANDLMMWRPNLGLPLPDYFLTINMYDDEALMGAFPVNIKSEPGFHSATFEPPNSGRAYTLLYHISDDLANIIDPVVEPAPQPKRSIVPEKEYVAQVKTLEAIGFSAQRNKLMYSSPDAQRGFTPTWSGSKKSVMQCYRACANDKNCKSFQYNNTSQDCRLGQKNGLIASLFDVQGYDYFEDNQKTAAAKEIQDANRGYGAKAFSMSQWKDANYGYQVQTVSSTFDVSKNVDFTGLRHGETRSQSLYICAETCMGDRNCMSFQYNKYQALCVMNKLDSRHAELSRQNSDHAWDHFEFKDGTTLANYRGPQPGDFVHEPNAALQGHNTKPSVKGSVEACMHLCQTETAFLCKSFDYDKSRKTCDLSDKFYSDVGGLKTDYPGDRYDHYTRVR